MNRKGNMLSTEQMEELLKKAAVGSLATTGPDGFPYVVPVHFAHEGNSIYIHGSTRGQKADNLIADNRVGLTVWDMEGLLIRAEDNPCKVSTAYQSVIITGCASFVEGPDEKATALGLIVEKYTPQMAGKPMPEKAIQMTAVIRINIKTISGKFNK